MEIKDGTPPTELEGWFDVLKSGGKVGEDVYQWTWNLTGKIGRNTNSFFTVSGIQNDGKGTVPCPIVNDPVDGQPAYTLTTTVATEWADTTINIDGSLSAWWDQEHTEEQMHISFNQTNTEFTVVEYDTEGEVDTESFYAGTYTFVERATMENLINNLESLVQ